MKARGWLQWGKWAFLGLSLLAIVMTALTGDGKSAAKSSAAASAQRARVPAAHAGGSAKNTAKALPDESRVELERMAQALPRQQEEDTVGNIFGATSWYVPPPPPPPPKPLPPPKPTAPPMPFTYLGLYEGAKGTVIMLVKGDRIYTVAVGDVIENTYRVERVEHDTVEMTYLPLNIRQSISTGSPS